MSHAFISTGEIAVSDHEHTWRDSGGGGCSSVDFGPFTITFDSAADARAVAARCLKAAAAIDALSQQTPGDAQETTP